VGAWAAWARSAKWAAGELGRAAALGVARAWRLLGLSAWPNFFFIPEILNILLKDQK
jgi:hypothetical protein